MFSPKPQVALFVNEHVGHPENRTNLALFALMMIAPIREWFLSELKLKLPSDAVIYPPESIGGRRPDLVVVHNNQVLAWIEIELGRANAAQLADYENAFAPTPVLSIVGTEAVRVEGRDHLSLEAIVNAIRELFFETLDAQQVMNVEVFTRLVQGSAGRRPLMDYTTPGAEIRSQPLVQQLQAHLRDVLMFGVPAIVPGNALVTTITQKGWTLRVFAKGAKMGSVALLSDQFIGRKVIRVPSHALLMRCLPGGAEALARYTAFLRELGAHITVLSEAQSLPLAEDVVLSRVEDLAGHVRALASVYGGKS